MGDDANSQIRLQTENANRRLSAASFSFCTVIDAFAHTGTYIVDIPTKGKTVASDLFATTMLPLGVRPIGGYAPKSRVLVMSDPNGGNAVILGACPKELDDPRLIIADSMVLRSRVGQFEDPMHSNVFINARSFLGNYSAGRPVDCLPGDWGAINDLGVAVFIGRLMASLKASDGAKVEAFWGDDLLRLVGYNYELFTSGSEDTHLNDEGEYDVVKRSTPYLWEALGIGTKDGETTRSETESGLQPGAEYAADEPREDNQIIIPRITELGGYLGDLTRTILSAPPDDLPYELYDDKTKHRGLADIIRSSDGTLINRSAKAIISEKYVIIPVPKQLKAAEDPQGDSAKSGYKPAGDGVDVPEFQWDTAVQSNSRQAQLFDYLAYTINKYTCAGLWKHEKDWYYPNESELELPGITGAIYNGDLASLTSDFSLELPAFATLKIDHRPGRDSIRYYQSRSIIAQLDDGSIVIEDGYGSSIKMSGGNIFISAPGDIWRQPGRNDVVWSPYDAIVRAGNCVDISAAKHDVRIKAENNLQLLGGNSGNTGGVLIESKSEGRSTRSDYSKDGQQNTSRGITIKSAGACDILAKEAYIGIAGGTGVLTLDAGTDGTIFVTGNKFDSRMDNGFSLQVAPEGGITQNEFAVTPGGIIIDSPVQMGGQFVMAPTAKNPNVAMIVAGNLICYGAGVFNDGVACNGGYGSHRSPGPASKIEKEIKFVPTAEKLGENITKYVEALTKPTDQLTKAIRDDPETAPGNQAYQDAIGFAFRTQEDLKLPEASFFIFESRWQQMLRLKGGGQTWDEPAVTSSATGDETYPHPGRQGWDNWSAFGQGSSNNFDMEAGTSKDRNDLTNTGGGVTKVSLSSGYLVTVKPD